MFEEKDVTSMSSVELAVFAENCRHSLERLKQVMAQLPEQERRKLEQEIPIEKYEEAIHELGELEKLRELAQEAEKRKRAIELIKQDNKGWREGIHQLEQENEKLKRFNKWFEQEREQKE